MIIKIFIYCIILLIFLKVRLTYHSKHIKKKNIINLTETNIENKFNRNNYQYMKRSLSTQHVNICKIKKSKSCKNTKLAILLTCYNVPSRHAMTNDVILFYLKKLKFPKKRLYLVDSANYGVSYDLIPKNQQAVFEQNKFCSEKYNYMNDLFNKLDTGSHYNSSNLEICSLIYAYNNLDFKDSNFIIKLTCKYKIPGLCKINYNNKENLLLQYRSNSNYQQSEIIGISRKNWKDFIIEISKKNKNMIFEEHLKQISKKYYKRNQKCRLVKLDNLSNYKRGDKILLKFL